MKISIIVPIYNSERYLERCIDSILRQTVADFEIILIDDGSTDKCPEICRNYADSNGKIVFFQQKNSGVSVARNKGIELAHGEFIGFVDSDDEILPEMFEKMLSIATNDSTDIVFCDALAIESTTKYTETIDSLSQSCVMTKKDITPSILIELAGAVWRGIYRRELIFSNGIKFPVGLKISEDRIFNILAIGAANKISYLKEGLYKRMVLSESTVNRYHPDYYDIVKRGKKATAEALDLAWNGDNEYKEAYLVQFVYGAIRAIENLKHQDSGLSYFERRKIVKDICSDEQLQAAISVTQYAKRDEKARWIYGKRIHLLSSKNPKIYKFIRRVILFVKRKLTKGS